LHELGRGHDDRHIAAGFAKIVCATQNAEMRHGPDLGQRGDTSKNELSLGKHRCDKALYACGQWREADALANPRASAHARAALVEQHDVIDLLVSEPKVVRVAGEGRLHHLGRHLDALRCRFADAGDDSNTEDYECQETWHAHSSSSKRLQAIETMPHHTPHYLFRFRNFGHEAVGCTDGRLCCGDLR
jgi:hypothetical protein